MSRKGISVGLFLTVVAVSLLFVTQARSGRTSDVETQAASDRVEAELLVLRSDGFTPREITRPAGRFLLALQNHSNEEELSLILRQETGASVREVRLAKRQSKLKELLQLPVGRYVLVDTEHPDWTCTITITPQ
jgi:hypothetical protein